MHSKTIEAYKKMLRLTQQQREVLVGLLLGDGHLETQNHGRTFRLKIEQSASHRAYVDWLYAIWKPWVLTPPQQKIQMIQGKQYEKFWFTTVSHGAFRYYAHQFYCQGIKHVPNHIAKLLTPRTFAVWFMDDGSVKSRETNGRIINTQGFQRKEVCGLAASINAQFGLHSRERFQKDGWQIFIPAADATTLAQLTRPYMIPEFFYKLPNISGNNMPKQ